MSNKYLLAAIAGAIVGLVPSVHRLSASNAQEQAKAQDPVAPRAAAVIVLNKGEATASLLEAASGKELAKIKTGLGPHEAAVSPDGRTVVVSNYGEATTAT
jgi:DNA-binding beta-propeller fold protein YncE